jgi:hypothetical protein
MLSETLSRCPGSSISQKVLPAAGFFFRQRPTSDVVRLVGSGCLVQRTNLLSPSVALLPVFKVTQITATMVRLQNKNQACNRILCRKFYAQEIHKICLHNEYISRNSLFFA